MLRSSIGSTVARVLGELTNVNIIFEATREANRRRLAISRNLDIRRADVQNLSEQAYNFRDLPSKVASCEEAEREVVEVLKLVEKIRVLARLIKDVESAEWELSKVEVPDVPSADKMEKSYNVMFDFKQLASDWLAAQRAVAVAEEVVVKLTQREADLVSELHATLEAAGQCPTCGQHVGNDGYK